MRQKKLFTYHPSLITHKKTNFSTKINEGRTIKSINEESIMNIAVSIGNILHHSLPREWEGKQAILEMKEANYPQWKQIEWTGFYFQFLCEQNLSNIMRIPGPKYGKARFDAFNIIPWDFKSHAINAANHKIIINDRIAVERGIRDYGALGIILALGEVDYNDKNGDFQRWHDELKGEKSKYITEREERGANPRPRKTFFELAQISFIIITNDVIKKCGIFQKNFRNSNGLPRKEKILLDLKDLTDEIIYFIDF